MRGKITLKLLESIKDFSSDSIDFWGVFISAGYGVSLSKVQYELLKKESKIKNVKSSDNFTKEDFNKARNSFYAMISNLKKDNLIEESKDRDKNYFKITSKGKEKMHNLKHKVINQLPFGSYKKIKNKNLVIIMFDIPESEKRKRVWLRSVLISLGFKMVQRSVWMGKVKIPKKFLEDATNINIINFIEIFEVGKLGSLKSLKNI